MHHAKAALAVALLLIPAGAVTAGEMSTTRTAVEHHTSYVELIANDGKDAPGFAAVAGIVACHATGEMANAVLWFNDQVLLRHGRKAPNTGCLEGQGSYVWATEEGAPDPRDQPSLSATGKVYEFTDPNGMTWEVTEYVYHQVHVYRDEVTQATVAGQTVGAGFEGEARFVPYYTWVVEIGSSVIDPTIEDYYNFVTLVDFSKLQMGPDGHEVHSGEPGDPKDGNSHNVSDPDERHETPHVHDTATLELWVGGPPEEGNGEAFEQGVRAEKTVLAPSDIV